MGSTVECNVVEDFNERTLLFPSPPKVLTYLSSCVKCNMVFVMIEQKYCILFLIHLFARDVLVMKKLEIEKIKPTFIISVLKIEI